MALKAGFCGCVSHQRIFPLLLPHSVVPSVVGVVEVRSDGVMACQQPVAAPINYTTSASGLSCRSLVTQDFLDYCCGVGGYVGLGGDGLTGDLDGDLA